MLSNNVGTVFGLGLPVATAVARSSLGLSPALVAPLTTAAAGVLLARPLALAPGLQSTMMAGVAAFMVGWKAVTSSIVPVPERRATFLRALADDAHDFVPFEQARPDGAVFDAAVYAGTAGEIVVRWAAKMVATVVLADVALKGAVAGVASPLLYATWAGIIACLPTSEPQELIVHLVSGGKYRVVSFNDWFLASTSLYEFWSVRYNTLISRFFRDTLYRPLRTHAGVSPAAASMAVFGVSGILHAYIAHVVFGHGEASSLLFFVGNGALVAAERWLDRNVPAFADRPPWLGWLLTMGALAALAPLYPGLFVRAWPQWLVDNPVGAHGLVVRAADHVLAVLLPLLAPLGWK